MVFQTLSVFLKRLRFLRSYAGLAVGCFALLFVVSGLAILTPLVLRSLIDRGIRATDTGHVLWMAVLYFGVEAGRLLFTGAQAAWLMQLGQSCMRDLRTELYRKLLRLPMATHADLPPGQVMTRLTGDVASAGELFSTGGVVLLRDIVLIVGVAAVLLALHPTFGLLTLTVVPFLTLVGLSMRRPLRAVAERTRNATSEVNARLEENLAGLGVIRLFGLEELRGRNFQAANSDLLEGQTHSMRLHGIFDPIAGLAATVAMGIVLWQGGVYVQSGTLTLGTLVAYLQYLPFLIGPVRDLGDKFKSLQSALAAAERLDHILLATPEEDGRFTETAPGAPKASELRFEDVSFGYRPDQTVLHKVSFSLRPGERVALIGRTGAGKSTISRLAARLYQPRGGRVLLDGTDLRAMSRDEVRSRVLFLTQETLLFEGDGFENVRLGRSDLPDEEVLATARACGGEELAHALRVDSRSLSLGERQLLAVLRGLVRRPSLIILDESTASLDSATEARIGQAFAKLLEGRTTLIIAHRPSTVRCVDRVLRIEGGKLIAEGIPAQVFPLAEAST